MGNPEQDARRQIDKLLVQAGWHVCDADQTNITAHRGVAIREFPLPGHGFADYLLYVDGRAAGVIEAKKAGTTLSGVEIQSAKYTKDLPAGLPCWRNPLPFAYQSTGIETRFTNGLDPAPRSRSVFAFHRPDTLAALVNVAWIERGETRGTAPQAVNREALRSQIVQDAVKPLHDPNLCNLLIEIKQKNEITIDHVSQDKVIEAGFSQAALDRAKGLVQSFEKFIQDHKDEITALQVLYAKPYKQRLTFEAVKELADAIERPPHLWNESQLWNAYATLEKSKVRGASSKRILTDLVSLVRFAIHQDNELIPFPERVKANFNTWLASHPPLPQGEGRGEGGVRFTAEKMKWLEMIRDHIAANLSIAPDDFEYAPFSQQGGLGKVHQLFGDKLNTIIEELNETLAA